MLGEYCSCTQPDFKEKSPLGKNGIIWSKMIQNRVFPLFWKMLSLIFAGNVLKQKLILLSVVLYKSHICGNSCSWIVPGKACNQLDCRILWSHISLNAITGSHWFFAITQIARRGKKLTKFFIECCPQMLFKSCSVTENSLEQRIKQK